MKTHVDQFTNGIKAKIEASRNADKEKRVTAVTQAIVHGIRCKMAADKAIKGQGSKILMNLVGFISTSGHSWGDDKGKPTQDRVIGEFLARLRTFLQTTAVKYNSDQELLLLVDKGWYSLQRTDWTVNLLPMLRKMGAPSEYITAAIISKLYPRIVDLWKDLDPDWHPVSRLLE